MAYDEQYETLMVSDIVRDGMHLELYDRSPARNLSLSAFYSDVDSSLEFERHRPDVPIEVEAWFQREARRRLPPSPDVQSRRESEA